MLEITYKVKAEVIPADHGYPMFGGIKDRLIQCSSKAMNGDALSPLVKLATIPGISVASKTVTEKHVIKLDEFSVLRLRSHPDYVGDLVSCLSHSTIRVGRYYMNIGDAWVSPLTKSNSLYSRLVIFRYGNLSNLDWDSEEFSNKFLLSCQKRLAKIGVTSNYKLTLRKGRDGCPIKLTLNKCGIPYQCWSGFGVSIRGLSKSDSLLIQQNGLGGKQHFGAGWMQPSVRYA